MQHTSIALLSKPTQQRNLMRMALLSLGLFVSLSISAATPVSSESKKTDGQTTEQPSSVETLPLDELTLLADVYLEIKRSYVHELSDKDILQSAIKGMTDNLDPYSRYLDAEQMARLRESATGNYAGIGISAFHHPHGIEIKRVMKNSPAQKSGLNVGDFIIAIGKESTVDMSDQRSSDLLRGSPGTSVSLTIQRGEEILDSMVVKRAVIELSSVASRMVVSPKNDVYLYVALSEFQVRSGHDIQAALRDFARTKGNTSMQGLILDLRNNPGGLFDSAIEVSDMFLNDGVIVTTRKRDDVVVDQGVALPGDILGGKPLVVLINRNSASSSEIVAGALQDHKRATIIGEQSYGKGRVQTTIPMANDSAIKLTTSLYYTPAGRTIDGLGITPDIVSTIPETSKTAQENSEASSTDTSSENETDNIPITIDHTLVTALKFLDSVKHPVQQL